MGRASGLGGRRGWFCFLLLSVMDRRRTVDSAIMKKSWM